MWRRHCRRRLVWSFYEGCADDFVPTVETGPGGRYYLPQGVASALMSNTRAILDMTSPLDFTHGVVGSMSADKFCRSDQHGNVGVHKFNGKIMGTGGFIDISATSQKIIFCGTLTAGSLQNWKLPMAKLNILQEGRVKNSSANCRKLRSVENA